MKQNTIFIYFFKKFDKIKLINGKDYLMNNLIIFSQSNSQQLTDLAKKYTKYDIKTLDNIELPHIEQYNPSVAIINISYEKLKELSMVMKFPTCVLFVTDKIPVDINIRAEAYDYILKPINEFDFSVKVNNLTKISELKEKISNISTTDDLTGLHNRKYLLERLEEELSRSKRYKTPVSCILFDIDFFKVINDMYGYEQGDILLKRLSDMLLNLARKEDVVTRYGDEEFMVILPNTSESNAFIFAERFRRDVEKMSFVPAGEDERHPVKISGGIASYPNVDNFEENANSLIRYAEHALYNSKNRGKNKITLFSQINLDC